MENQKCLWDSNADVDTSRNSEFISQIRIKYLCPLGTVLGAKLSAVPKAMSHPQDAYIPPKDTTVGKSKIV